MGNWFKNLRLWLFVATFFSCAFTATYYAGQFDIYNPLSITYGLPFALSLMFILLAHESGHYFVARWWGTKATGPLFIPLPISPLGTLGAVISMDTQTIPNRRAIFDIGAAGPWAGVIAIGATVYFTRFFGTDGRIFGQMAMAIFVGILITGINLFPLGQFDGGHVLYALTKKNFRIIEILSIVFLVIYMLFFQTILSPIIIFFFVILFGLNHPPTQNDDIPLDTGRKFMAALTMLLLLAILLSITLISAAFLQNPQKGLLIF